MLETYKMLIDIIGYCLARDDVFEDIEEMGYSGDDLRTAENWLRSKAQSDPMNTEVRTAIRKAIEEGRL